jgi:LacI family transcriptional regulator
MSTTRVTLKMIAEMSGVSRGTVDRVLNKRGDVKPEIVQRVEEIVRALNYVPNTVAKCLATQRRNIKICVILHVQGNLFIDEVMKGIDSAALEIKDFGIRVSIKRGANFDIEDQLRNIREALAEGFSAIILVPLNDPRIVAQVNEAARAGVPVIFMTSYLEGADYLYRVGCDLYKAGRTAAELFRLLAGEHARIGVVTPSLNLLGNDIRLQGMRSAIETEYTGMRLVDVREIPNNEELAYSLTKDMLKAHPEIDALFYATGHLVGGLEAIRELGLFGKLRIVSVDQSKLIADAISGGEILATICQGAEEQGYSAVKICFDYLVTNIAPRTKNHLISPTIKTKQLL